jgi:type IV secretion system protein VirB1
LGLTVETVFDPCTNIRAASALVVEGYGRSLGDGDDEQGALHQMLSIYNTGDPQSGFTNGYVEKVLARAEGIVPALSGSREPVLLHPALGADAKPPVQSESAHRPTQDVFAMQTEGSESRRSPIMIFE